MVHQGMSERHLHRTRDPCPSYCSKSGKRGMNVSLLPASRCPMNGCLLFQDISLPPTEITRWAQGTSHNGGVFPRTLPQQALCNKKHLTSLSSPTLCDCICLKGSAWTKQSLCQYLIFSVLKQVYCRLRARSRKAQNTHRPIWNSGFQNLELEQ